VQAESPWTLVWTASVWTASVWTASVWTASVWRVGGAVPGAGDRELSADPDGAEGLATAWG